ncbi:hypothetical protein FV232_01085 [Methylobacterium sp. WL30]|uniref:hypothetical protein n=1 Tax=unclassified Methylobacterium TaxID=2615210 RepID=UPI0011C7D403|nr:MULTISPECIES: hypothetical protein [unclassified Methylobacterium]TXN38746.1 hypothetical protein FV225_12645 [Methylobacterium sp. WL93]TXN52240.1 hypothetical protein FV227_04085 [Methylobacterium sp. WL119]TXN70677.1 hypothetical protein FV232_01085 [Methylobacterium sp. WL30]
MILTPFSQDEFATVRAVMRAGLTDLQVHLLAALRANARGEPEHRADGSLWRGVTLADADLAGASPRHFAALRAAGLFEPVGIAGGTVLISHAAEVRP